MENSFMKSNENINIKKNRMILFIPLIGLIMELYNISDQFTLKNNSNYQMILSLFGVKIIILFYFFYYFEKYFICIGIFAYNTIFLCVQTFLFPINLYLFYILQYETNFINNNSEDDQKKFFQLFSFLIFIGRIFLNYIFFEISIFKIKKSNQK